VWTGWAVAAALAGVVAGLSIQVSSQQNRIDTVNAQTAALSAVLGAPDVHSGAGPVSTGGSGLVLDSRSRDEAVITLAGLSGLPSGKAYQLWMIGPSGARSSGLVTLDARGSSGPILARGLGDATKVGLTVEPAQGSRQPTTTPIMLLPVAAG
jgi:hypothetical protein